MYTVYNPIYQPIMVNAPCVDYMKRKRNYRPVDVEKRQALIQIIESEGITIKEASERLNMNYSTAKYILKTFRSTGMVETQQMMRRKLKQHGLL